MSAPRICLIHPNPGPRCETFVTAHAEGLPNVVEVLYGGHMPYFRQNGESLLSPEQAAAMAPGSDGQGFSPDGRLSHPAHIIRSQALADFFLRQGVELVLAEYGPTGVAVMHACEVAGVPLAVHFHGYDASIRQVIEKYDLGYRRMFGQASAVIAVSRRMENDLLKLGASRQRLHYNVCGVDMRFFAPTAPENNPPLLAAVGRFVDKKAPHLTVMAFAQVLGQCPEARLAMLGDGPLRETCRSLARALGADHAVDLPGDRPPQEVAALLSRARAFVQHSVTPESGDKEGTPVAVIEAGASGLPVVSTRHAGIPDVVLDGETGLLCEENDVEAYTANMLRLAREPHTAAALGRAARDRMVQEFNMKDRLAALARILRNAARKNA